MHAAWLVTSLVFATACYVLSFLPHKKLYFVCNRWWSNTLIGISMLRIHYHHRALLEQYLQCPAIVIANHSSSLDIPLVDGLLGNHPRFWISNVKFTAIPIFGQLLRRMHIPVNPLKPKEAIRALELAQRKARSTGQHIMMFPDGTRHDDGKIHEFRSGFVRLAEELDRPIIPICLSGMEQCSPFKYFLLDQQQKLIHVVIGEPFFLAKNETRKEFIDRIERWFKLNQR